MRTHRRCHGERALWNSLERLEGQALGSLLADPRSSRSKRYCSLPSTGHTPSPGSSARPQTTLHGHHSFCCSAAEDEMSLQLPRTAILELAVLHAVQLYMTRRQHTQRHEEHMSSCQCFITNSRCHCGMCLINAWQGEGHSLSLGQLGPCSPPVAIT
jgi:hypothetical protein